MKLSFNWLKEFVDFDLTPAQVAELLTFNGIETTVAESGGTWTNVVTAKVVECGKHPQADKLSVCSVSDGVNTYPVVCGAPNVAAGQIVALARIGAELPGAFKIKKAKLRGVESEGMICSASELGLSGDSSGIIVLPENTPRYMFLVEFGENGHNVNAKDFLKSIEEELRKENSEYRYTRDSQLLEGPVLKVVRKGEFEKYRARRVKEGANDSQFKVPELTSDPNFYKNFAIEEEIHLN